MLVIANLTYFSSKLINPSHQLNLTLTKFIGRVKLHRTLSDCFDYYFLHFEGKIVTKYPCSVCDPDIFQYL